MPAETYYKTYARFLSERFPWKMQKLSVNVGSTCPNRDGTIGTGGCVYCNNTAFVPAYCEVTDSVAVQLEKGKKFFGRKYPDMHYMAYFQAFTSTYGDRDRLLAAFVEALRVDRVEALIISTRPDCIDRGLIEEIRKMAGAKRVMWELGVETTHNVTLGRINRGHTWEQAREAISLTGEAGHDVCAHLIFGLPGETREMMFESVRRVTDLPVTSLKFHQLQILRHTTLCDRWECGEADVKLFTADEYLDFCSKVIEIVPAEIAIERFTASSPDNLLVAPRWNLKNYQFTNLLHSRFQRNKNAL